MISIKVISKSYGKKGEIPALHNISLEVKSGELFGLIGPDGAGKTTLFRILTTLILADSGSAKVMDLDVVKDYKAIRNIIGYMPGRFSLYQDLSVLENLTFFATIFNTTIEENYHLIKDIYVQLEPFKNRRAGALSGGMKQKLALCCALIHKPKILFLDEPTTGVDVVSRKEFWDMLKRLKSEGITIFVSTPYMDEASLCDRIALIQNGRILETSTPQGLIDEFTPDLFAIKAKSMNKAEKDLALLPQIEEVYLFGEHMHLVSMKGKVDATYLRQYLKERGHEDIEVTLSKPTIEDVFMHLMKDHKTEALS